MKMNSKRKTKISAKGILKVARYTCEILQQMKK